jgi:hypothetical protein
MLPSFKSLKTDSETLPSTVANWSNVWKQSCGKSLFLFNIHETGSSSSRVSLNDIEDSSIKWLNPQVNEKLKSKRFQAFEFLVQ